MHVGHGRRRWFHSRWWAIAIPVIAAVTITGAMVDAERPAQAGDVEVVVDELATGTTATGSSPPAPSP